MKLKLIVMVLMGIGIGLVVPYFGPPQNAIAQQVKQLKKGQAQPEWENKVVNFDYTDDNTKALNALAADRWEYVGLLGIASGNLRSGGQVAFKREKN